MLVGEPGVGKTAIAELLAQRIVKGRDSSVLSNARLLQVSVSSLMAGASHAGEREARLESLLDDVVMSASR